MENEQETIIDSNNEEPVELQIEEPTETENKQVEKPAETPEAKHARLKRQLEQQEKKMGLSKEVEKKKEIDSNLSQADLYTLMRADVDTDDVSEVTDFVAYKKQKNPNYTVKDALNDNTIKSILRERKEERTVADATNVGTARRGSYKPTPEILLDKARKGEMPDSDADIASMIKARKGIK